MSTQNVVPAQLSFLTIYNPAFGDTDDTAYEQIFCYCERRREDAGKTRHEGGGAEEENEERGNEKIRNQRLRNVGLARGMVEFAK